jgi:hypothetical protein
MTYCDNQWVSDFTYEGIRSYLVGVGLTEAAPEMVAATDFLAVMGMADLEAGTASLESVYLVSHEATLPLPEPGDWTIALVDAGGADLATYPFAPDELSDAESSPGTPAVIAELIPWTAGAVKVEIRHGDQVLDSRQASANAPTVELTSPADGATLSAGPFPVEWTGADADGDALSYSLLYSNDGLNWETLAAGLTDTALELNTDQLPGGSGQLRVVVSDGFLSGQDLIAVTVPLHAPTASITQPGEGQVFHPTQQVVLEGTAYDLEDGSLGDAAFAWSSDLDGALGTGLSLAAELSTGTHVITLTVTDSDGMSAQAQRTIEIAEEGAAEALSLDAAPLGIAVVAPLGAPALPYTITLRTTGETELDWTAAEDIPWLSLESASGQTPTDLVATIDPSQLPVGLHCGTITFTSAGAGNSPVVVPVTLQVSGYALRLPMISR